MPLIPREDENDVILERKDKSFFKKEGTNINATGDAVFFLLFFYF